MGSKLLFAQDSTVSTLDTSKATIIHVSKDSLQPSLDVIVLNPIDTAINHRDLTKKDSLLFDYLTVESITYNQYMGHFWDELIVSGNKALQNNIDYYYLRVRLGVAYYEQKKYREAEKHFTKALAFNNEDPFLLEYLYFTYLKNEHYEHALKLSINFDSTLKTRTVGKDEVLQATYIESGSKLSNNSNLYKNAFYVQAGIGHRLSKYLNVNHAITKYNQNGYYGSVKQSQYYLGIRIPIKNNWIISPAFHYVSFDLDNSTIANIPHYEIRKSTIQGNLYGLSIKKSFKSFDLNAAYAYSEFNSSTQNQESVSFNYYPLANNNLSLGAGIMVQQRKDTSITSLGYSFNAGYKFNKKFKLNAAYYFGNLKNNNEENGYIINNSYFITTSRLTIMPQVAVTKKMDVYLLYQYENKSLNSINFHYQNYFLGLKLKF
jgi:hypothetical protein